jgi:hypothetical protein
MTCFLLVQFLILVTYSSAETPTYNNGTLYEDWVLVICWMVYGYVVYPVFVWFLLYARATYKKTGFDRVHLSILYF